jgi:hypothetical protein
MDILTVVSTEQAKDKNQRAFSRLRVTSPPHKMVRDPETGTLQKVYSKPKIITLIAYPVSYLPNGEPQFGHDLSAGDKIEGRIVTRKVAPYKIGDREVHTASVVVAGNTEDIEEFSIEIDRAFRCSGFRLMTRGLQELLDIDDRFVKDPQTKPIPDDCLVVN